MRKDCIIKGLFLKHTEIKSRTHSQDICLLSGAPTLCDYCPSTLSDPVKLIFINYIFLPAFESLLCVCVSHSFHHKPHMLVLLCWSFSQTFDYSALIRLVSVKLTSLF